MSSQLTVLPTDESSITDLFPMEPVPGPELPTPEAPAEEAEEKARLLLSRILMVPLPIEESDGSKTPSGREYMHEAYRRAEDLSDMAKAFYGAVGKHPTPKSIALCL